MIVEEGISKSTGYVKRTVRKCLNLNAGNLRKNAKFEVLYFLGKSLENIEFITFGEIWSYKN